MGTGINIDQLNRISNPSDPYSLDDAMAESVLMQRPQPSSLPEPPIPMRKSLEALDKPKGAIRLNETPKGGVIQPIPNAKVQPAPKFDKGKGGMNDKRYKPL